MAQQIKLKRSAIAGKVPTTSSLDTGELAINTADGKLYFKKDDNTIQTIVTTNALVTGSLNINGPVTASFFKGDGSAVTGVISASYAVTASYAVSASYATTASYAQNLVISGSISTVDYIDFSTTATVTQPVAGRVSWNSGDGTLDLGLDGGATTIQLGQSQAAKAYNAEATSLTKGEVVYISGSQGQRIAVKRAVATAELGSANTIGIVTETITAGAEGYILTEGQLKGLDTSAYTAGRLLYLSTASGQFTQTSPVAPNHRVTIGFVERVHPSAGSIYVKIDNGYEIDELHNVLINGVSAGDLLIRSGSVWHNSKTLSGSYTLTGSLTATGQFIGSLNGNAATATTASYALTASYLNQLNQDVVINGNLTVFGTSSFTYVTSSQLNVDAAFISVNVFEPVERFGGLKVYDSGSSNATASLAWDSLHNHWVYQNVSGSTYTGGMLLSGPRNTGSLGDEPNLAKWYVPRSDGGDHLDNSQIYSSGSVTKITGSLTTSGKVNIETVDNYGSDPDKFLAIVSNEVVYRTGAQLLSDIGGQTAGTFVQNAGGGGQARYIMRYEDSNSATTSSIYEDTSGNIGIKTLTPRAGLDLSGSNAVINEHTFGRGSSTSLDTIAIGSGSLSTANTVSAGVFIGTNAGMKNTQGQSSVVIGNYAAYSGSNVRDSVIIGDSAGAIPRLSSTQFPYQDVYIGRYSGYNNNGYWNTAIGYSAMREQNQLSSAQATNNVAVGTFALYGDDFQGNENVGIGVDALAEIRSGSENIGIGTRALVALKNAGSNIAIGYRAFHSFDNNAAASPQGGFGSSTSNVGLGYYVGYNLLSGSFNTFLGPYAGADYYTGSQNVVLGYDRANDLNNTQGNLAITAGGRRVIHSRDGVTTLSGSLALKGTTTVVQQGILVSGTTSLTVASISTGSYEGAFLDYVIASGSNKRAGTLATVWTPSDIEWNDVSTLDLGSTVGAEFTPTLAGSNANLVLAVPTGTWTVKGHLRYM